MDQNESQHLLDTKLYTEYSAEAGTERKAYTMM